jgi:hypothetical protein
MCRVLYSLRQSSKVILIGRVARDLCFLPVVSPRFAPYYYPREIHLNAIVMSPVNIL